MQLYHKTILLVLLSLGILGSIAHAQKILSPLASSYQFEVQWEEDIPIGNWEKPFDKYRAPWFKGASLDPKVRNLPCQEILIPIGPGEVVQIENITVTNRRNLPTRIFEETGKNLLPGVVFPSSQVIAGEVEVRQGKRYQHIRLYPVRFQVGGGEMEKADQISFSFTRTASGERTTGTQKTYADHSVLAAGNWVKIGVSNEGLYKLTYQNIRDLGWNPDQIDPRTLRLFGNGGHTLPQRAGSFPHDDLTENPVWVSGQADGVFNPGDFLLFYGQSPHEKEFNVKLDRWVHKYNVFSDTTYYFLTYGQGNGLRISQASTLGNPTQTPTYTDQLSFYEKEVYNPLGSGRYWLGETFDLTTSRSYDFPIPGLVSGSEILVTSRVAARSPALSSFQFKEGNTTLGSIAMSSATFIGYGNFYVPSHQTFTLNAGQVPDQQVNLQLVYDKPQTSSVGYLDFIEVQYQRSLNFSGQNSFSFYAHEGVGPGEIFLYRISGASSGSRVWDITDPTSAYELDASYSGGQLEFQVQADSAKQFIAFNPTGAATPASMKPIGNQDLHGLSQVEYLILSPPQLRPAAERLARFHRQENGLSVHIVSPEQVYNEFGSGIPDPTSIRDFLKMFYDRWQDNGGIQPRYFLLFGEGSYDRKQLTFEGPTDLAPTYQSRNSHHAMNSFSSDDFYGFLDDGEGFWGETLTSPAGTGDILYFVAGDTLRNNPGMDIAVGRLPVANSSEAEEIVTKIINYQTDPEARGPWRNRMLLVADYLDGEGNLHIGQADGYTDEIENAYPCINIDKLYMSNYQMVSTASANTFPDGKDALFRSLNEGALIANYTGHGGETGWSNASILTISDINQLENSKRLPAFVTATCEFGRWDDPARRSGAEQLLLNPNGGGIALFTTVRVVEAGSNQVLNRNFYDEVFRWNTAENRWPTLGEVFRDTKNASSLGGGINNRNFSLLGDPALTLSYPRERATITKINGQAVTQGVIDSLPSLSLVTIEGEVRNSLDQLIPNFNGELSVTVFDKPTLFTTNILPYNFYWQKNRIFNGKATVKDGIFSFQFVVPLDVSYDDGSAKISLYFQNAENDGGGCYKNIYAGGTSANSIEDDTPPEIELYMNDEKFVDGGMVGPDPMLIVEAYDETGMNTTGSGIGHELTAILDGDESHPIVLNDYYEAIMDSYQEGEIRYPFSKLPSGTHEVDVKVWDVANNSSSGKVSFLVSDDSKMALGHVLNYPNPFTTNTKFYLEHNLNGRHLNLQVKIFTVSGRLVKTLEDSFYSDGNLYCDMEWDGLDEFGDAIGRGVYVYQVMLKDELSGEKVSRFEKLVVLR